MSVIEVNKDNFEEEVLKSDKIVLVDFFADYLIYYTRKEVTYELLTHEYNYWR